MRINGVDGSVRVRESRHLDRLVCRVGEFFGADGACDFVAVDVYAGADEVPLVFGSLDGAVAIGVGNGSLWMTESQARKIMDELVERLG